MKRKQKTKVVKGRKLAPRVTATELADSGLMLAHAVVLLDKSLGAYKGPYSEVRFERMNWDIVANMARNLIAKAGKP